MGTTAKRAGSYAGRRAALRMLPWVWPYYAGVGLYRAYRHELTKLEQARLRRLARKSLGMPPRLSAQERSELVNLLTKLSPFTAARFVAAEASPLPWPKAPD
jgi:hypothetical protein